MKEQRSKKLLTGGQVSQYNRDQLAQAEQRLETYGNALLVSKVYCMHCFCISLCAF
jgi:hypothetical protein